MIKIDFTETDAFDVAGFNIYSLARGFSEDRIIMPTLKRVAEYPDKNILIGVLDGMSNPPGGRFASEFALNEIRTGYFQNGANLDKLLDEINARLIEEAIQNNARGAGTTLALLEFNPSTSRAVLYSAGDSVAYFLAKDEARNAASLEKIKPLEIERSKWGRKYDALKIKISVLKREMEELEKKGRTSQDNRTRYDNIQSLCDTENKKIDNVLEHLAGIDKKINEYADDTYTAQILNPIDIDPVTKGLDNYLGCERFDAHKKSFIVNSGDYIVACSDGISLSYELADIARIVGLKGSTKLICEELAKNAKGDDDKSAVVLSIY